MNRAERVAAIERIAETFKGHPHIILTGFRGLSVAQATELRRRVREVGGAFRVIKNRLAKIAAEGTAVEALKEEFAGPRAIAFHKEDPVGLAKALRDFAKDNPQLELVAGVLEAREVLDARGVQALASLPGLAELRAQLLALIQTPATQLVRLLGTPAGQVARALDARREQLEGGES